ncbi:hypothetical protein C8F04DRAFT_1303413 [Mycena alexandri]|uniref:Uncharacterized protein n=1 Tax=Mycena alexandri TaxID=1745969 RepID=A0AAD6WWR2_9AGAR|nr:hypothetical protein C8F04DRAFT_1303413 [Mycena alexandri]
MSVLLTRSFTAHFVLRHEEVIDAIGAAGNTVYITSNMIADSVFIFRCYSIWNRRLAIIVFPALLVLVAAGLGCAELMLLILYLSQRTTSALNTLNVVGLKLFITSITVSLLTTVVLMALTMGRIWSLARAARVVMGQKAAGTYYTVCAMILESGALYVVFGTGYVAIGFKLAMVGILPGVVLAQVVVSTPTFLHRPFTGCVFLQGIAPTIIAVRVGLGCSVEDVNSFVVPPRAAQRPFAAKMQTVSDESLGKHVLYIHATENEAAGQIG